MEESPAFPAGALCGCEFACERGGCGVEFGAGDEEVRLEAVVADAGGETVCKVDAEHGRKIASTRREGEAGRKKSVDGIQMRLFRVIVPVGDIEAATSFYGRVLGRGGERVSRGRHYFDCEGTILACYDAAMDGDGEPVGPNRGHVYLATDDLSGVWRRLCGELGARGVSAIEDQPWGERTVYAADPWGNRLCFVDRGTMFVGRAGGSGA